MKPDTTQVATSQLKTGTLAVVIIDAVYDILARTHAVGQNDRVGRYRPVMAYASLVISPLALAEPITVPPRLATVLLQ
jgi:hypothetical protein